MLYNPKWETKPDVFSLQGLIAWLEKQPADKEYCYTSNGHCLIAQYLTHHGYQNVYVRGCGIWYANGASGHLPDMARIANPIAMVHPNESSTFGGALERAYALETGLVLVASVA
jgi:hypothetical protein